MIDSQSSLLITVCIAVPCMFLTIRRIRTGGGYPRLVFWSVLILLFDLGWLAALTLIYVVQHVAGDLDLYEIIQYIVRVLWAALDLYEIINSNDDDNDPPHTRLAKWVRDLLDRGFVLNPQQRVGSRA